MDLRRCLVVPAASLLLALPAATLAQTDSDDVYWTNPFQTGGPNEYTDAIVPHDGSLIMGGNFSSVCATKALYIARWGDNAWHPLGTGVGTYDIGLVHVIRLGEGCLYAGGMFDRLGLATASNIGRFDFDTQQWVSLGTGMDRAVRGIAVAPNGDVFAVGEFTTAGGVKAQAIARWDGQAWHDVGGSLSPRARALALVATDDAVYVGGYFDHAGDVAVSYIAKWTGDHWEGLGTGVNDLVTNITVHDGALLVGGAFTQAGGKPANHIAKWDGKAWHAFGAGLGGAGVPNVRSIEVDIDQVYVAGTFTTAGGKIVNYVTTWDGSDWLPLGSGVDDQTKVVTLHDGVLWVGGNFLHAGGKDISYVATWTKPGRNTVVFDRMTVGRDGNDVRVDWRFQAYRPLMDVKLERRETGQAFATVASVGTSTDGSYVDSGVIPGREYDYALVVVRDNGVEARSAMAHVKAGPTSVTLEQNRPNPFNPTTTIRFSLPASAPVVLRVYDTAGRLVRTLVDETRDAGIQDVAWDGRDDRGIGVATGVYFYRMSVAGNTTLTRKMILVK
jgi:FlgD Ig-like domain/Domain of unknown function (DUF5122) beta-propeller